MFPGVHAAASPNRPAVIVAESGETMTYGELETNSARFARVLHDRGVRKGDVIAVLSDNSPVFFEIYWAALRSGLYITAINHHLSAREVAFILEDSDAKVLVASMGVQTLAESLIPSIDGIAHRFSFDGHAEGYEVYEQARDSAGPALAECPRGSDMLYSSGTTGRPKGIKPPLPPIDVHEPGEPITMALGTQYGFGQEDVYLSPAPLYHAAPLRWCGAIQAYGGTVVMMTKFDAEAALVAIEKYSATVTQMVPTMFIRMLQLPDSIRQKCNTSSLRVVVHAAAPCPRDIKRAMIDWWGPIITEYYSSTEGNGFTSISAKEWMSKPGSVGRSALGIIHICDDAGNELPNNEVGTVYFERDIAPFSYHKDPVKTAAARHPDQPSWTAVGDLGYVDDDGYLFLTDRKSFVIISGGVNIYPQEIEDILIMHPAILDVAVIGVPDFVMGQQVKAVVQLKPGWAGSPVLADEIISYTRDRLARFKAPRTVDFIEDMPRTPTGKLVKRLLEERYTTVEVPK